MPSATELQSVEKKLASDLRKLRTAMGKTGASSERERDTERKRASRLATREVIIPACENRQRREDYEQDDAAWLRYYFGEGSGCPDPFWYAFTFQQEEMIEAIRNAIKYGGDQSIAASRGEGKTTLLERLTSKYTLAGVISFSVLCAKTGVLAQQSLETIQDAIQDNRRLLADYPEVCVPVVALENAPSRANGQVVTGHRHDNGEEYRRAASRFSWCGQEVIFPNVPGSPSARSIMATRGLDSAVRGLKIAGRRPQLIGIDDPDTEDSARSEDQAKKIGDRIDRALGGMGGQQRAAARVMLTTLQNRICVGYRFTDPSVKPTWKGKRFRYLMEPPEQVDYWDEYVQLLQGGMESGEDEFGRAAHQFYIDHREEMQLGAKVANPHRFDATILPDGSQLELSSLQHYYNMIARIGPEAVACELDNDPPEEAGPMESGITARRIQKQLSGYNRKIVPPDCVFLTQGIDVHKYNLQWVVRAWRADATNFTIDYGVEEVHGTKVNVDEGVELAIVKALAVLFERIAEEPYTTVDGTDVPINLSLIDARYKKQAVYEFCRTFGRGVYPAMGFGKSQGCVKRSFWCPAKSTKTKKIGHGWVLSKQPEGIWLIETDADHWKEWEHDRWMTAPGKPGAASLFGEGSPDPRRLSADEKLHHSYAHHIVAEVVVEEIVKGALTRYWKPKSPNNHKLDCSYMADVAAAMLGVRLLQQRKQVERKRIKLSELQAQKRGSR